VLDEELAFGEAGICDSCGSAYTAAIDGGVRAISWEDVAF